MFLIKYLFIKSSRGSHGVTTNQRGPHDVDRRPLTTPPFEVLKRVLLLPRHHPRRPHPPSSSVMSSSSYAVQPPGGEKKPWSAKKLIKVLETKYGFSYNEKDDYIDAIDEEIVEGALVFNYEGDFIVECDEPEEEGVEEIYQFIRKCGWSLDENPIDANAWVLYPTKDLKYPLKTLIQ